MVEPVRIGERLVGPGQPCYVIAEAGVNHNGDIALAKRLIEVAREANADAVKFQTFVSEEVISPAAPKAAYQEETTGNSESQLDMVKKLELPPEAFRELQRWCEKVGITFLSTPFDYSSADLLAELRVPAIKIASGEITNTPFLEHLARKSTPLILSTGMSTIDEVGLAIDALRGAGSRDLILLHCVSSYPAAPEEVNLRAMRTMQERFHLPAGFSDHTMGTDVTFAAVALGACVIEKHFTLDRTLPGPDHRASLEPKELAAMVRGIRDIEAALGDGIKRPTTKEVETAKVGRRSLMAACEIPKGAVLTEAMVVARRPGTGLPPSMRARLIGSRANRDIPSGALFTIDMFG